MKTKKIFAIIALNILLILVLQAGMKNAIAKPQGIVLQGITRHNATMYGAFETAFLARNPDVDDIQWLEISDQTRWATAINSPSYSIDLLWGGGPTIFNIIADAGLMLPLENPELIAYIDANISETVAGGDMFRRNETTDEFLWVGAALSSFGFTVNHANLAAYGLSVPHSWEELASTDYFLGTNTHAIGMGDAPETTSNTRVYQIILQKFGWEAGWDIITRMAGNSKIFDSSDNTRDSVITGSQAIAMTIDFYGYQAEEQNDDCEYIIPEFETIVNADPIAIAKGSEGEEKEATERFIQFVMSPEGQAIWLDKAFNRLPMVASAFDKSLEVNGYERPQLYQSYLKTLNASGTEFDEGLAGDLYDIVTFYFHACFTQSTTQLYSAWETLGSAYDNQEISLEEFRSLAREFAAPSITLEETRDLQDEYLADPTIKDSLLNQFRSAALSRYSGISASVDAEKGDDNNDGIFFNEFAIDITSLTEEEVLLGTVPITAEVVDYRDYSFEYSVKNITFSVDGTPVSTQMMPSSTVDGISTFSTMWDTSTATNGSHSVSVDAYEFTGRSVSDTLNIYVGKDIPPPLAAFTTPLLNATVNETISISAFAQDSDPYFVSSVTISIVGTTAEWTFTSDFSLMEATFNTSLISDGEYILRMVVTYTAGNTQTVEINIHVKNEKEETEWKPAPGFEGLALVLSLIALAGYGVTSRRRG